MTLVVRGYHSEKRIEYDDYWSGQMRSEFWLELHNEDVDSHYTDYDMEPHD